MDWEKIITLVLRVLVMAFAAQSGGMDAETTALLAAAVGLPSGGIRSLKK